MRQVAWAKTFGLPLELVSPEQAREMFPLMDTAGVRCGSYLATDGYLDPSLLTMALADGAREGGARIFTHTRVTAIDVDRGLPAHPRVRGVQTEWGPIEAEVVVNAGGMFAAEIGRMAGVRVPIVPFAHEYLVTQPFRDRAPGEHLPTLRDPDLLIYFREEGGGLIMGGYERNSAPWALDEHLLDAVPADFNGRLLEEDWPRFEEIAANSRRRVPAMDEITVTRLINGPEAFTPGQRVLPGRERGHRFLRGGRLLRPRTGGRRRDRQGDGRVDPRRRAGDGHVGDGHPALRAALPLALLHAEACPGGLRDLLRHPLPRARAPGGQAAAHLQRLPVACRSMARRSARSRAGSGSTGTSPTQRPATSRCARAAGRGCTGRRRSAPSTSRPARAAGLFDESSFAKLEIAGPGAAAFLEGLCDNRVAREVGAITYTQMLNRRGGIECDFTVTRVEEELFSIVTGTAFGNHDLSWIRRHAPRDGSVRCSDVTARWACFALWGPRAKEILAPLTPDPLDFPYMRMRELTVGDVPVRALRVTFVGELGWELYCPTEYGADLWRTLWEAWSRARPGRWRLQGDRLDAPGEGLPRVGSRHHPRRDAVRGGAGLLRQEGGDLHRLGRARLGRPGAHARAAAALPGAGGSPLGRARQRARAGGGRGPRQGHQRRIRLQRRALDRLRLPSGRDPAGDGRSRSTSSASGPPGRSPKSRCSTRRGSA